MKRNTPAYLGAILLMLLAAPAKPQELVDFDEAVQMLASQMPQELKDEITQKLLATGKSADEVQEIVARSIDSFAVCAVTAALEQGRIQGYADGDILGGLAGRQSPDLNARDFAEFDIKAWKERTLQCREKLNMDLQIEVL